MKNFLALFECPHDIQSPVAFPAEDRDKAVEHCTNILKETGFTRGFQLYEIVDGREAPARLEWIVGGVKK